jgi:ABC-type oligopeptide transport system ATPase subunit
LSAAERLSKAEALMEEVGLQASDLQKKPSAFSGGQRQRIGIARALAADPELLICDESVSALDVSVQAQVLNLLNGIKKNRGLSMIFISHDPDVVRYMCDRIIELEPLAS